MTSRRFWRRNGATGWALSAPATLAVIGFLIVPIAAVIAGTFMDPRGAFAPYIAYFNSGFRTTVLFRTLQISAFTTIISLIFGFMTAYVVSRAPGKLKSLLIVAAVFPLLTGVVVRAFAWLIILGRNGILNQTLLSLGIVNEPLEMLYTQGAVIVGMVYLFVPLMVLSLVGVLENIPKDVLQASSSLGASPGGDVLAGAAAARRARPDRRRGARLHRQLHRLCDAAAPRRRAPDRAGDPASAARHGVLRLGRRLDDRDHHDGDHDLHRSRDEPYRPPHQPHGHVMSDRPHPILIGIAALVYLFLMLPARHRRRRGASATRPT